MRRLLVPAGVVAAIAFVAFGVVAVVAGLSGGSDVTDRLQREKIVGTPDMKPATKVPSFVTDKPDCDVAGQKIDSASKAKCFADWMRVHALEATGGKTYAEMPRFIGKNGKPTNDEKQAAIDPKTRKPVENEERGVWVTETALGTALNTSYFAYSEATFTWILGLLMIVAGIGFAVLALVALRPLARVGA
jgi:hypothetical protein